MMTLAPDIRHPALSANLVGEKLVQEIITRLQSKSSFTTGNFTFPEISQTYQEKSNIWCFVCMQPSLAMYSKTTLY